MSNDLWEVYQRLEVMRQGESWDAQAYDVLVWSCDAKNKITAAKKLVIPSNYVRGLLRIKLNGASATTQDLDVKLTELKLTRADLVKVINE